MTGGIGRIGAFVILAFSIAFFLVYEPAAHRADYEQAVFASVAAQADEQDRIIAVGPKVDAADAVLRQRLVALRVRCRMRCTDVVATADEVAAMRRIAKAFGVDVTSRTFNTDGTVEIITDSTQAAALRFLDGLGRLPAPMRLTRTTFTAEGHKVKMDLSGQIMSGAAL